MLLRIWLQVDVLPQGKHNNTNIWEPDVMEDVLIWESESMQDVAKYEREI
jgi:hypothetical protein